jgi:hypothetical protein
MKCNKALGRGNISLRELRVDSPISIAVFIYLLVNL